MDTLLLNGIMFFLFIMVLSVYRFFKYGIKGLNLTFYIFIMGIIFAAIETIIERKTFPIKMWIILIVIFIFSVAMLIYIKRK